jgi:hypothetical protein
MERLVKIVRFAKVPRGVFGALSMDGFKCCTLEPPDKGNQPFISCIPEGIYQIARGTFTTSSGKTYPNFHLIDVPGRDNIEIHVGNDIEDTEGCILVGKHYRIDAQHSKYWITDSKYTMGSFMNAMFGIDQAWLVVRWL